MGDELKVQIPKYAWKGGATRAIQTELRKMADKFGLDMATAQQAQGVLWIKGDAAKIQAAKPTLRELVQAHFPDADMPEELTDRASSGKSPKATPKSSPASKAKASPKAAPSSPKASPKRSPAAAPRPAPAAVAAPAAAVVDGKLAAAVPSGARAAAAVPGELLWLCMIKTSSFVRKCKGTHPKNMTLSAEPGNIAGMHSYKYSTVAHSKPFGLELQKDGDKEKVSAVIGKGTKCRYPRRARVISGVTKCKSKGLQALRRFGYWYRRDLAAEASTRYLKVLSSFKKRRRAVRSRRMRNQKQ